MRPLSPREIEVLCLIADGLTTKQIAGELGITFKTADCHRSHIAAKLNLHSIAHVTRYAVRNGFVEA